MPTDLYTDATYPGQVARGNVEAGATAANFKLVLAAEHEVVALFSHKADADAALAAAGEGYALVAGPGLNWAALPNATLGALCDEHGAAGDTVEEGAA